MLPVSPPSLAQAPGDYSQEQLNNLVFELELLVKRLNELGEIKSKTLVLTDLPTASAGLATGSVWNNAGTLKIV